MKRGGYADLPLHYGKVPAWLYERMRKLGLAIVESIIEHYDTDEVLRRLSDPLWFQSLGAVLGMDWHSSGITTSVMGALKHAINPLSERLGIRICGGRGKHSRQTPDEIEDFAYKTGINGNQLVRASRLSAKIDNSALQDGFQIYLHSFVVANNGNWTVVQQGLNAESKMARRYHWTSSNIRSFLDSPHTAVVGKNMGQIINLAHKDANKSRENILDFSYEHPLKTVNEIRKIIMPSSHEVNKKSVNLKRLGATLALAYEKHFTDFESFILLEGVGPRTLFSLAMVSEVIYGSPSRFTDPARFSFAHGGKDAHPFPVTTKVYDETIATLRDAVERAKIDKTEKIKAIKKLHERALQIEKENEPIADFNAFIEKERRESKANGGRSVVPSSSFRNAKKPIKKTQIDKGQLTFDFYNEE